MSYIGNTATQQAFTPAVDFFNGNGSTVAFTLSRPVASVAQVQAVISNVPQKPGDAFTVSGNTITFTSAPPSGTQNIYVYYTSPITQVIAPGQGTVGTAQIQNGAVIPADLSTGAPTWDVNGNVGIGTSTPTARLQVLGASGTAAAILGVGTNGDGGIVWRNASNASVGYTTINSDNVEYRSTNDSTGAYLQKSGITFPATQFASANANTLDDYEEGLWTPAFTSVGASFTYPRGQYGSYVKIGSLVYAQFYIGADATGTTTNANQITGFPFASANLNALAQASAAAWVSQTQAIGFTMDNNSTLVTLWRQNAGIAVATAAQTVGGYVVGMIVYRAA